MVSSYLELPYTVGIMAITVLLADFRFYQDFSNAIDEESDEDTDL